MTYEEAKDNVRYGDWVLVAELCGISAQYAQKLSERPGAKRHSEVMEALMKVVEQRRSLLQGKPEGETQTA